MWVWSLSEYLTALSSRFLWWCEMTKCLHGEIKWGTVTICQDGPLLPDHGWLWLTGIRESEATADGLLYGWSGCLFWHSAVFLPTLAGTGPRVWGQSGLWNAKFGDASWPCCGEAGSPQAEHILSLSPPFHIRARKKLNWICVSRLDSSPYLSMLFIMSSNDLYYYFT